MAPALGAARWVTRVLPVLLAVGLGLALGLIGGRGSLDAGVLLAAALLLAVLTGLAKTSSA